MASSSRSHHHDLLKNTNNFVEQEKEEEEENWLKLGLGLGRRSDVINTSSFNNQVVLLHHIGGSSHGDSHHDDREMVKLGLGLGFEEDSSRLGARDKKMMMIEPTIGYKNSLLLGSSNKDHYSDDNDDGNGMVKLWVPSWQIDGGGGGGDGDSPHHVYKCGLWFTLRPSTNQGGEALPQIPKAYIRIRDENMTVFMVKKYLVRKLGLSNEAEIDISCMGESLSHIQTLKQVRDAVWIPRLIESLDSTTFSLGESNNHNNYYYDTSLNHIMSLLYRKHCFF